ncbi:MAG: hypothetical protein JWN94_853 [Betaproteobacteria bacterium]|nr:hypothetical protein [Betaproteobacteria bacterium]
MEWLLTREVVIGIAILGAVPSVLAGWLRTRDRISESRARQMNVAGYGLMGLSMLLFIIVGFRAH